MRRDTMWGCLGVLLLVGAGIVIGWFGTLVWVAPRQADARAAVTPHEAPQTIHTLRGARTACTALHERLEGMQLPSHSPVVVEGE